MRVHFVVHEAFEAPGAYARWAQARGFTLTWSRVHAGEPLPTAAEDIDLLVVMGGPQSPVTTRAECPHFDADAEQRLIGACIEAGRAVLGVCLGAQLIGQALGASFGHSPEPEIGCFPITLTAAGHADPLFAAFGDGLVVGHWHNDMPGLTRTAVVIAASEGCPRQIVRYGARVYGFQCHMEFDADVVELMIAASTAELADKRGRRFVQQAEVLRSQDYTAMNRMLYTFLDGLVAAQG